MKKGIGIAVLILGCIISAIDIGRMINGLAYGWGSILGGFILALASWVFLMESDHGLLLNTAKTAGCIAIIVAISLLTGDPKAVETPASPLVPTIPSVPYPIPDKKEPQLCWTCVGEGKCKVCGGSGEYDYGSLIGNICRGCEGSGKCPGCGGDGFYD